MRHKRWVILKNYTSPHIMCVYAWRKTWVCPESLVDRHQHQNRCKWRECWALQNAVKRKMHQIGRRKVLLSVQNRSWRLKYSNILSWDCPFLLRVHMLQNICVFDYHLIPTLNKIIITAIISITCLINVLKQ